MTAVAARIGLFGKLPSQPDFIRFNAGGPLAVEFDRWIHEGLVSAREPGGVDWESRFDDAPPFGFVFHGAEPQTALIGLCRPGRDQGDRRYPFSVFVQGMLDRRRRHLHLLPIAHGPFLSSVRESLAADSISVDDLDLEQSARLIPQSGSDMEQVFEDYFSTLTMGTFWRELFGDPANSRKYLVINRLFQVLVPYRGKDPSGDRRIIRLPLGNDLDHASQQVSVWLALIEGVLGDNGMSQSSVFWRHQMSAGGSGECLVTLRPPDASMWEYLFLRTDRQSRLLDTEHSPDDQTASPRTLLGEPIAGALDREDLLLRDFIRQF